MERVVFAIALALLLTSGYIFYITYFPPEGQNQEYSSFVQRVIDGDTLVLASGERVRLIGIDAPEKGQPCFDESKQFLRGRVSGKPVELEYDAEKTDQYGRILAYLFVDGNFVNLRMAEEGYATAFPFEPNLAHAEEFAVAEASARGQQKGCLWKQYD